MINLFKKYQEIFIVAFIAIVFFGSSIGLGIKAGPLTLTLFRVAIPVLFIVFFLDAHNNKFKFKSFEKQFVFFLVLWVAYAFFLLWYRALYKDAGALKELMQLILDFFVAISIIFISKKDETYHIIFKICRISVLFLIVISIIEIFTGIHLSTSAYYNPLLLHIGDSSNPQKATGIFFNENDLSVCLTLFTPLFFPLKNKGYKINVFYIIILSVIEFILLKNDSMICFFSLLVGFVLYAIFYGIKYKWIFVSLTYFYLLEKLIFFLSISRSTKGGLSASVEEQFSIINNQTGSAYIRLNTYIIEFIGSIKISKAIGLGPYGINYFLEQFDPRYVLKNPHSVWLEVLGNYGIFIFLIFTSICIISFVTIVLSGEKRNHSRAIIISMDVMLILLGFVSSNYIGIAYWWIVIAISISSAATLLHKQKCREGYLRHTYIIVILILLICMVCTYLFVKSARVLYKLQEPLKVAMVTDDTYKLKRYTDKNITKVIVKIDNEPFKQIIPKKRLYEDNLNFKDFTAGWHQYTYNYTDSENKSSYKEEYLINRVNDTLTYMIPVDITKLARAYNKHNKIDIKSFYLHQYNLENKYLPLGFYWNAEENLYKNKNDIIKINKDGIPYFISKYKDKQYNSGLITSYALVWYTDFLSSQNHQDRVKFIRCSEWLIENQKNDGSIEFDSAIKSNDKNENDSISVKTLGEMLSVFARAYKLTGEEKYNQAGIKTLNYMLENCIYSRDTSEQNEDKIMDYLTKDNKPLDIFENNKGENSKFRLDNQLYALIGLCDWANTGLNTESQVLAKEHFNYGVNALNKMLPLYDLDGYISEDLTHFVKGHDVRCNDNYKIIKSIALLKAVAEISNDVNIQMYYDKYFRYIQDNFYKQNKTLIFNN